MRFSIITLCVHTIRLAKITLVSGADRQTDSQTDRQTGRQADRQADRTRDTSYYNHSYAISMDTRTHRHALRQTNKYKTGKEFQERHKIHHSTFCSEKVLREGVPQRQQLRHLGLKLMNRGLLTPSRMECNNYLLVWAEIRVRLC